MRHEYGSSEIHDRQRDPIQQPQVEEEEVRLEFNYTRLHSRAHKWEHLHRSELAVVPLPLPLPIPI